MNPLWMRQIAAVARLELVKSLFALRALPLYLLAAAPVGAVALLLFLQLAFGEGPSELQTPGGAAIFFANLYQFIIRLFVYAGCVWIFMNLIRGEVLDRSLHYYFLAPIRRDVLIAGKFLSGWISSVLLFVGSTVATMVLLYLASGVARSNAGAPGGPGFGHLLGYVTVTMLACLGYGAVFLFIGLLFRNPIVPALLIWIWEQANPFLPVLLKKISVIFYLQSMLPVRIDEGPFAVIADPVPTWLAVPGLLVFTALVLITAGRRIRRMEIAYGND